MGREAMYLLGRLLGGGPEPASRVDADAQAVTPLVERHGFDQVSRTARVDPRLSHRSFRVLATLESYCFGDARESWACNRTIGQASGGIGSNAVRLALRELEKLGYVRLIPDDRKMRGSRLEILYLLKRPDRDQLEE
jgi:hypothetical protein